MDKIFGKKKTVEQQLRDQDREMRRNQRGLQRDRAGLEKGKVYLLQITYVTWPFTGGNMKCPKKHVNRILSCDSIDINFWNAPKSENYLFGSFSILKLITCLFFEMPHFLMFENFEMPHFSYLILKKENSPILGHFKILCIWNHVKNIYFTYFFGAFHITPRMTINK